MNSICPNCGAPLQENAGFCPHCMTVLTQKQELVKPKRIIKSKKWFAIIITAVVLAAAVAVSGTFATVNKIKHAPICTVERFERAITLTSERANADSLWNAEGFIDIRTFKEENIVQYSTDTYLGDAFLSVFFYNDGEEIYSYFCDIKPEDFDKAQTLMKCILQSACNDYFSDLDKLLENEKLYPKSEFEKPFYKGFTELLSRTDQYNEDIANGAKITTRYLPITDGDFNIWYYITERETNGEKLYDLALEIEKA